ncbi:MAG: hypothetical protein ACRERD_25885, partial [Candidatus Binatia bacterium]
LWIIEHRAYLRGDPATTPVEEAASDFVGRRSEKPVKKVVRAVKEKMEALGELVGEIVEADTPAGGLPKDEPQNRQAPDDSD